MGYGIERNEDGTFDWWCASSAYGAAAGTAQTLAEAKVELAIAEADMFEHPYPPAVCAVMRSDYERFATDWPDPEITMAGEETP
jgi:hypothetical protein